MELQELREELTKYIKIADERKLNAIYTLVEEDIENEHEWSNDEAFVADLNERVRRLRSGEDKGITEEEAMARFKGTIEKHKPAYV